MNVFLFYSVVKLFKYFCTIIELISKRDIFDICDIILNILGISIGYFLSKKIGVKINQYI